MEPHQALRHSDITPATVFARSEAGRYADGWVVFNRVTDPGPGENPLEVLTSFKPRDAWGAAIWVNRFVQLYEARAARDAVAT